MIRIVIADDHAVVREGIKRIVSSVKDVEVAGEAGNGTEVMQRVRELDFDVLLLDLSMPGRSGMELIKSIRAQKPRLRILILSMHQELQYAARAIKNGASGYLSKDSAPAQLEHAIRKVASGGAFISAEVAGQIALGVMPGGLAAPHECLSDREFEVLQLLVAGITVTDIGSKLNVSPKTASTHKAHLMQKLGLQNQAELIRYALKHELAGPLNP